MIDLSQGIDFSPLNKQGVDEAGAKKLLLGLLPLANLEVQAKIKASFAPGELEQIAKQAVNQGVKPEEGAFLLEEKYYAKTGRYFMEELRLMLNDYVVQVAKIIAEAKADAAVLTKADKKSRQELEQLLDKEDYQQAAKLLETILKQKSNA